MKTLIIAISIIMAIFIGSISFASEAHEGHEAMSSNAQTNCPVMGGAINKDLYVDVEGKRIYVCCAGCIDPIKKDPQKYIMEMEKKGIMIEDAPEEGSDKAPMGSHKEDDHIQDTRI